MESGMAQRPQAICMPARKPITATAAPSSQDFRRRAPSPARRRRRCTSSAGGCGFLPEAARDCRRRTRTARRRPRPCRRESRESPENQPHRQHAERDGVAVEDVLAEQIFEQRRRYAHPRRRRSRLAFEQCATRRSASSVALRSAARDHPVGAVRHIGMVRNSSRLWMLEICISITGPSIGRSARRAGPRRYGCRRRD